LWINIQGGIIKMQFVFSDIVVKCPDEMPVQEAEAYVKEQLGLKPGRRLVEMEIGVDGDEVRLEPHYASVVRVRRITGYLSTIPRFNDAKKEEEQNRLKHIQ
jgi:anaerobic ribonucleoside-triphosphate reductase activating protein